MTLLIALCALFVSLAALLVARRSSEREKRLVLAQRRSDLIAALREMHRALDVHVTGLDALVPRTVDAVQNAHLERLYVHAEEIGGQLADLRDRLECTMIPPKPPPGTFRDLDEISAEVMTARRDLDHHAAEATELRARLQACAVPDSAS